MVQLARSTMRRWACIWYENVVELCERMADHPRPLVRCALTFLAIQEPGISNYCERCGTEYLTEEALLDDEKSERDVHQPNMEVLAATTSRHEDVNLGQEGAVEDDQTSTVKQGQASSPPRELAPLVRMLFSTYDVCVYCGGKFVG